MRFNDEFRLLIKGNRCVYCGENSTTLDHYPPASIVRHGLLMPCCLECNIGLSAKHPFSFTNRCSLARENIRRKYKKILKMPDWDEDELMDVDYNIRTQVIAAMKIKNNVNERLNWKPMTYLSSVHPSKDFKAILVECDLALGNAKMSWTRDGGFVEPDNDEDSIRFIKTYGDD